MLWHFIELLLPLFPFLGLIAQCCCGSSCTFWSDDFSSNDISNYTQVSGSWSISGGVLSTSSSSGVLTGNTANPNSDSNTKISVTVNIATDGDAARIILDYQNSSNYWFAEIIAGSSASLKIYQRSGGTNTVKAKCATFSQSTGSFSVCASIESGATFRVTSGGQSIFYASSFTQTGYGLGTGTLTGSVTFDNLEVDITSGSCAACAGGSGCNPCSSCTGSVVPATLDLTIAGVVNGTCSTCSGLNVTLLDVPYGGEISLECNYNEAPVFSACSDTMTLDFDIDKTSFQIFATFNWFSVSGTINYSKSIPGAIDCTTLVGTVLNNVLDDTSGRCHCSSSTLTISGATFA